MRRITLFCLALALLLAGLAYPAAAQNVSIQLTPLGAPIQIPASGGNFDYIIAATNNGTTPQQATVWCNVTLPNGNPYGPVLGPVTITLNAGQTLERQRTQNVPAGAPAGNYAFNAYIGVYPDSIWDSDIFTFEKVPAPPGGTELWLARYNGPGNGHDQALSLAVDGGSNVYVTGWSDGGGNNSDYATIKYDADGNQIWAARYNGPAYGSDEANSVAVDRSGNVYVTGRSYGSGTSWDYATIKYDASGNQLWAARYNGPANGDDEANSLAVDGGGSVFVTGYSYGSGTYADYATIKYDAAGNQLWVARYNGLGNYSDWANSLAVDGGGSVFVTGYSYGRGTYGDYATIKYDAAGNQLWVTRYNGPGNGYDCAYSLALDGGGNVYVTGSSGGSGTEEDYATIKYDANGNQLWAARYTGPGYNSDVARSLAVDGGGNVYLTGGSYGSATNYDYATIKYSGGNLDNWMPVEPTVLGQPLPQEFALHQNYPNPFNATTVLSYQLPVASHVSLRVYDTAGRLVATLVDGWRDAGTHELTFDASHLPSGMYVYRIQGGNWTDSGKMVLLK